MSNIIIQNVAEYSIATDGKDGELSPPAYELMCQIVGRWLSDKPTLPDHQGSSVYLANGGVITTYNGHIRYGTPECATVLDSVVVEMAGTAIMAEMLEGARVAGDIKDYSLGKRLLNKRDVPLPGEVMPPNYSRYTSMLYRNTYNMGAKEKTNDLWNDPAFLVLAALRRVTSVAYLGAGGVSVGRDGSVCFSRSQKAPFVHRVYGADHRTSVLNLYGDSPSDTKNRILHDTFSDAHVSPWAMFMDRATGLLVALMGETGITLPDAIMKDLDEQTLVNIMRRASMGRLDTADGHEPTVLNCIEAIIECMDKLGEQVTGELKWARTQLQEVHDELKDKRYRALRDRGVDWVLKAIRLRQLLPEFDLSAGKMPTEPRHIGKLERADWGYDIASAHTNQTEWQGSGFLLLERGLWPTFRPQPEDVRRAMTDPPTGGLSERRAQVVRKSVSLYGSRPAYDRPEVSIRDGHLLVVDGKTREI